MVSRPRAWADTDINVSLSNGGTFLANLLNDAPTVDTLTVVRMVGGFQAFMASDSEVETFQIIDCGIGVASLEAFNVGVAALPDVDVSTDYPPRGWLYRARRVGGQALPTAATPTAMWRMDATFNFDVRSMRKIDKGVLYMHVLSTNLDGSGGTMKLVGLVRALCLT